MIRFDLHVWIERKGAFTSHLRFGLPNMLLVEQELTIQVTDVDRV